MKQRIKYIVEKFNLIICKEIEIKRKANYKIK